MSFTDRIEPAFAWDNEVADNLKASGFDIGRYNIENIAPHFANHPNYINCENVCIRYVCYFPDGIAASIKDDVAFLWDAKLGGSIEQYAYESYCEHGSNGRELLLFVKYANSYESTYSGVYCIPIKRVIFKDSYKYVSNFNIMKQLPINGDGWIAPREWLKQESTKQKYYEWKRKYSNASGTPFKYFDFEKMSEFRISFPFNYKKSI